MASPLEPCDQAPDFDLTDQHEKLVRLRDFHGRKVLVVGPGATLGPRPPGEHGARCHPPGGARLALHR
jgi:hypothetical protein